MKVKKAKRATPGMSIRVDVHEMAKERCEELEISFSRYVQKLIMLDIERRLLTRLVAA